MASAGTSPGIERFATARSRGGAPVRRRRSSRISRSSRHSGPPVWLRSNGSVARSPADVPVIIDAKRGDIGSTAARQATALYDGLGADAITVNPYLGGEAIAPLIDRLDRFAYVLCRTSNPGAVELQSLVVGAEAGPDGAPAEPLYARVARRAAAWGTRRDGRAGRRRHRAGRAGGDPGHRARARVPDPGCRCPGWGGRPGPSRRPGHVPTSRRAAGWRTARERFARDRRRGGRRDGSGRGDGGGRRANGPPACPCYPSRRERHPPHGRLDAPQARFSRTRCRSTSERRS